MAQNTVKSEKTGFGMVNETASKPVIFRYQSKNPAHLLGLMHEANQSEKVSSGGI